MAEIPGGICDDIERYFSPHFRSFESDYVCVYGSSTYKGEQARSDIDLFLVAHGGSIAVANIVDFVSELHERHDRRVDLEVPYENKVFYTSEEVDAAIAYEGLHVVEDRIVVPRIDKNEIYLSGPQIKARLAINALTTPHIIFGHNLRSYQRSRERAEDAITLLATQLVGRQVFSQHDLFSVLVQDPSGGESGEMYLGYKTEYPAVNGHLEQVLGEAMDRLSHRRIISRSGDKLFLANDMFPLTAEKMIISNQMSDV